MFAHRNGTEEEPQLRTIHDQTPEIIAPPVRVDNVDARSEDVDDVITAYVRQATVSEAQKRKTALAMKLVVDLHRSGHLARQETFTFLDALDDSMQLSAGRRQLYEQASREQLMMEIQHMNQMLELGIRNIRVQVGTSVDAASGLLSTRRGAGIVARFSVGARLGIGPFGAKRASKASSPQAGSVPTESRGRFDGIVIGDVTTQPVSPAQAGWWHPRRPT